MARESHGQTGDHLSLIDMHAHFFQMPASAMIKAMDDHQVSLAVVMPVPNAGAARGKPPSRIGEFSGNFPATLRERSRGKTPRNSFA